MEMGNILNSNIISSNRYGKYKGEFFVDFLVKQNTNQSGMFHEMKKESFQMGLVISSDLQSSQNLMVSTCHELSTFHYNVD